MTLDPKYLVGIEPLWVAATAVYHRNANLEKRLTFKSKYDDEPIPLYRIGDHGHLFVPRALCPSAPIDQDFRQIGVPVHFPNAPVPRDYQVPLFSETLNFLQAGQSGVVSAYTGFGKSALGLFVTAYLGRKTIVITTKEDIAQQWIDGAHEMLGLPMHEIGEIRGDKCEVIGTKFVVAMIQSLSKDGKYPPEVRELFNEFGLVIIDEAHRMAADQFCQVAFMFPALLRLGLSATPKRPDGKDILLDAHIGPLRAVSDIQLEIPKVLLFKSGWACPRVYRTDPDTGEKELILLPHEAAKSTHIEKIIAADPKRNLMIAEMVKEAFDKGRKIVVFSTLHDHLESLMHACTKHFQISQKHMGLYVGAVGKKELAKRDTAKGKPIIFTTFAMMSEGTSIDDLDTCILAMPRSKVIQPVGRIRRTFEGKKSPVVMDIVDFDSPLFTHYAHGRINWYKSLGCEIKHM